MTDPLIPRLRAQLEKWRRSETYAPGSTERKAWKNACESCANELEALLSAHEAPQRESRSPDGDGQSEVERVVSSEGQADVTPVSPQAGDQRSKVQSDQQPVGVQGHGGKPQTVNAGGRVTEQYEPQLRRPRLNTAGSEPADSHSLVAHEAPQSEDAMKLRTASESVGWLNSVGPLNVAPSVPVAHEAATPVATYPISLNAAQEHDIKLWAADDGLWTTQDTVEFNLRTFARKILATAKAKAATPARGIGLSENIIVMPASAEAAPVERPEGWQPIETAPKDGTWILLGADGWTLPGIGQWSRLSNCWQDFDTAVYEPTHWMPLPALPPSTERT